MRRTGQLTAGVALGTASVLLLALAAPSNVPDAAAAGASGVTYIHDDAGRLMAVVDPATSTAIYSYDATGNIVSVARQSSATVSVLQATPKRGVAGAAVTVYGTGFSATPTSNTVSFNGRSATVTSASATVLQVTVPSGATTGPISVTSPSGSASSSFSFTISQQVPSITAVSPTLVDPGTTITVTGARFDTVAANDKLQVGSSLARVTSVTTSSIAATLPTGATSGRVVLSTPNGEVPTSTDVFLPPPGYTAADITATGRATNGVAVQQSYDAAGRTGLLLIDGTRGQRLSVVTNEVVAVALLAPDGRWINTGFTDPMASTLPISGTYTLVLTSQRAGTAVVTPRLFGDVTGHLGFGSPTSVTIDRVGQNGRLTFSGTRGQMVSLTATNSTLLNGTLRLLYASGDVALGTGYLYGDGGFIDTVTLPRTGTYTVSVEPGGGVTGHVALTLYLVTDVSGTTSVDGPPVDLAFTTPGQNARLTFTGTAGQRISATGTSTTYTANLSLLGPDGGTVATPAPFLDATVLPVSGTYTVVVDPDVAQTGTGTVQLYGVTDQTGTVTPGGAGVTVHTTVPGQNAAFTFTGSQGEVISAGLATAAYDSGSLQLVSPDGTQLASAGFATGSEMFLDAVSLPASGSYTLVVDPAGPVTGDGTLTVYNAAEATGTLTFGTASSVTIATPGQNARLAVTATANQRISVTATGTSLSGTVSLVNANGVDTLGASPLAPTDTPAAFVDTVTVAAAGTYYVLVDPSGAATGGVTITAYSVTDSTGNVTVGSASTRTTSTPGQNVKLNYAGTAGQRVFVRLTNMTFGNGQAALLAPDGSALERATIVSSQNTYLDTVTLPATGTYKVFVDPAGAATGRVTVTLYVVTDVTGTITAGGSQTVTTSTPGQNVRLTFSGTAGTTATASVGTNTFGSACLSILDASDTPISGTICLDNPGGSIAGAIPTSGTYTILLDPQAELTGSGTISLTVGAGLRAHPQPRDAGATARRTASRRIAPAPAPAGDPTLSWVPGELALHGTWTSGLRRDSAIPLSGLRALRGVTALTGTVADLQGRPLPRVTLQLGAVRTRSDSRGRFLLLHVRSGHQVLHVDGGSANRRGAQFGDFEIGVDLKRGTTTALPYVIWMPALDTAHTVRIGAPTTGTTRVTTPLIPGLELRLPPGSTVKDDDGHAVRNLGITPIPIDRPPFPLPAGVEVPIYFTIQPGSSYIWPRGAQLIYPNYTHERPGSRIAFWDYDPDKRGWYVYGHGTVTHNGRQVVPDKSTRIWELTGAMIGMPGALPPSSGPLAGNSCRSGDPVDCGTGLWVETRTDLTENDTLPLSDTWTYRQNDGEQRRFGVGGNDLYGSFLARTNGAQGTTLVLPDGGIVRYTRTSPGVGLSDAILVPATPCPNAWRDSVIEWNGDGWDLSTREGTVYVFGVTTGLEAIRDRFGNTISIQRGDAAADTITRVVSPHGRWLAYTYDTLQRVTGVTDQLGRSINYTYDAASGSIATVTNARAKVTTYGYDANNRLRTIQSARGNTLVTVAYDTDGLVQQQTQADGGTWQFAYTRDPISNSITKTTITNPTGDIHSVSFDADGYPTAGSEAIGTALERSTSVTLDPATKLPTSTYDPAGRRTDLDWDSDGNLRHTTHLAGTTDATTIALDYDNTFHQVTAVTDPLSHTTEYGYDDGGNLTDTTDPLGHVWHYGHRIDGRITTLTDPLNHTTTLTYDAVGDPSGVTDALNRQSTLFLDAAGRVSSERNALGQVTKYKYDADDNVTQVTDATGNVTSATYDADDNLKTRTDARNNVTTYTYDALDRLITRQDPLLRSESWTYDGVGRVTRYTNRRGQKTIPSYDQLGRLSTVLFNATGTAPNYSYASKITYGYDNLDRPRTLTDTANGTISRDYDVLDRLASETTSQGTVSYTYDAAGRPATTQLPGQAQISYTFDAADRLQQITQGSRVASYTPDNANRLASVTLPNGITGAYTLDAAGQLTNLTYTKPDTTTVGDATYTYDTAGQVATAGGSLTSITIPASATGTRTYDADNQLTSNAGTTLTYNADGQLTSDGSNTYSWNARGELTGIAGATTASYAYDATGRRRSATTNGATTTYLYDGWNIAQETQAATTTNYLNAPGVDRPLVRTDSSGERDYLTTAAGVAALTDSTGTITSSYDYTPYGITTTTGETGNKLRYQAREDDNTGLYYNRARYYSPALGRFISQDPLGDSAPETNPYEYAGDNPVDNADPFGLDWLDNLGDWTGGFGDVITFGGTRQIRRLINYELTGNTDDMLNHCSVFYQWGGIGGGIASLYPNGAVITRAAGWLAKLLRIFAAEDSGLVNLASDARTTHILEGDATGGGHLWPGAAGKTPFPQSWSAAQIMHTISDIATDPAAWENAIQQGSRTILVGTRDGVEIRVVVDSGTGDIITGYPINMPSNS